MKLIPLTKGYFAQVDDEDFERLSKFKWNVFLGKFSSYGTRCMYVDGKKNTLRMHRFILGVTEPNIDVDHIDGNGLNNQKSNLRPCSRSQNTMNSASRKGASSRFKGVCWSKKSKRWLSTIMINGKQNHIGSFLNEEDAARAYNAIAKKTHPEFARLNDVYPMFPA